MTTAATGKCLVGKVYGVVRGFVPHLVLLGNRFHTTAHAAQEYLDLTFPKITDARVARFTVRYEGDVDHKPEVDK